MIDKDCKVTITWLPEDVQSLSPDWSMEECEDALRIFGDELSDRSISQGWSIISDLIETHCTRLEGDFDNLTTLKEK